MTRSANDPKRWKQWRSRAFGIPYGGGIESKIQFSGVGGLRACIGFKYSAFTESRYET
jgi:hypothetical protein